MAATNTGFELIYDDVTKESAQKIWDSGLGVGYFSGLYQTVQVVGGKAFRTNAKSTNL